MRSVHTTGAVDVSDDTITATEAAHLLRVTRRTFERYVAASKIRERGPRTELGHRRFARADVENLRADHSTLADRTGPTVLTGRLTVGPDWLAVETGVLRPTWLIPGERGLLRPEQPAGGLVAAFLRIVTASAPPHHRMGTFGARIIDAGVDEPGTWHADPGGGVRFVAVAHSDPEQVPDAGQEFANWGIAPSNRVVAYTTAVHRCPVVPEGRRIFLSATTYPPGLEPDLSYCVLAALRGAPRPAPAP